MGDLRNSTPRWFEGSERPLVELPSLNAASDGL